MAIKVERHRVCDVCGEKDTRRYSVRFPESQRRLVDLCAEHERPLLELLAVRPKPRRARNKREVVTEEDVARTVKPARKRAAKKATSAPEKPVKAP